MSPLLRPEDYVEKEKPLRRGQNTERFKAMLEQSSYAKNLDLREFVRQDLGDPARTGRASVYHSPFREDNNPSFLVYHDGFIDKGDESIRGDIFDYVRLRLGLPNQHGDNFKTILEYISGQPLPPVSKQYQHKEASVREKKFSLETVWQAESRLDRIEWYLKQRGITREVAENLHIGHEYYPVWFEDKKFLFDAIAFPNVYKDTVHNFKMRLITDDIWMQWYQDQNEDDIDWLHSIAEERPAYHKLNFVGQMAYVYAMVKDHRKYVAYGGGITKLYGHQCLFWDKDGKRVPRRWLWLFWTETELDAAMLQSLGYPAISQFNNQINVNDLLPFCQNICIINDNDKTGFEYIKRIRQQMPLAEAIGPSKNYKDVGELYQAEGPDAIHKMIQDRLSYASQGHIYKWNRKEAKEASA